MMKNIGAYIQEADWKLEKHVPVIECPEKVAANEVFDGRVGLGRQGAHPTTTEHHIRWVALYFHAEGDKFPYEIGRCEFSAHGEAGAGANQGPVYTHHQATFSMKTSKPGTLHAMALCNIHGLWQSSQELQIG